MSGTVPQAARTSMLLLRAGLAVAALGIIGFFLSYGQVGAPALASADFHPMPPLAWASIVAWAAGMVVALGARTFAAWSAARRMSRTEEPSGAQVPEEGA